MPLQGLPVFQRSVWWRCGGNLGYSSPSWNVCLALIFWEQWVLLQFQLIHIWKQIRQQEGPLLWNRYQLQEGRPYPDEYWNGSNCKKTSINFMSLTLLFIRETKYIVASFSYWAYFISSSDKIRVSWEMSRVQKFICYYLKSALSNLGGVHNAVVLRLARSLKKPNQMNRKTLNNLPKTKQKPPIPCFFYQLKTKMEFWRFKVWT